jgi:chromate transporter
LPSSVSSSFLLRVFTRASILHIGAIAATTSLRADLVEDGHLESDAFSEAFAVSRLTPGTNFFALYVLLGKRLAGWPGVMLALMAGAIGPSVIAVIVAASYLRFAHDPLAVRAMQGARAGALAVLVWAVVRLAAPPLREHGRRGIVMAVATGLLLTIQFLSPVWILILAGAAGAVILRGRT